MSRGDHSTQCARNGGTCRPMSKVGGAIGQPGKDNSSCSQAGPAAHEAQSTRFGVSKTAPCSYRFDSPQFAQCMLSFPSTRTLWRGLLNTRCDSSQFLHHHFARTSSIARATGVTLINGSGFGRANHQAVRPPSTMRSCPVTKLAASLSRKMVGPTISSTAANRPIGVCALNRSNIGSTSGR